MTPARMTPTQAARWRVLDSVAMDCLRKRSTDFTLDSRRDTLPLQDRARSAARIMTEDEE